MAASRRRPPRSKSSVPDEADILEEVGAEVDEETGEILVDPKKAEAIGAVDAESVRENRRTQAALESKNNGDRVSFSAEDIFSKYEWVIKSWPPSTLHISVKRMDNSGFEDVIKTHPRNGAEAIEAIKAVHGQHDEAKYAIGIYDTVNRQWRGRGVMMLPDTRQQGGQMNAPPYGYPPQQQPPPWGYQQPQQPQWGYPPAQPPQQPPAAPATPAASEQQPQQPPIVHVQPPPQPDPMQVMQQAFRMIQEMQQAFQQQHPPQTHQPPPQPPMPPLPPPGPGVDPMQYMQQAFEIVQRVQAQQQSSQPQPQPQPQQQWAPPPQQPSPQNSMLEAMGLMREMFDMFQSMQPRPAPAFRRPSYEDRPPPPAAPPQPPEPPKTPAQQFQDSIAVVKSAASVLEELKSLMPQPQASAPATIEIASDEDDDSPIKVIDTGSGRLVLNKSDGSLRGWESIWANADKLLGWAAEQREAIQKAHIEHQAKLRQQSTKQLPPGYVEVDENYEPPPGFVAVPVDRVPEQPRPQQQPLPPPPANMPPPIQATPPSGRSWEMPSFQPSEGDS